MRFTNTDKFCRTCDSIWNMAYNSGLISIGQMFEIGKEIKTN